MAVPARGIFGNVPAPTSEGGGYEYAQHINREPHGPTYEMVASEKDPTHDPQDPHWTGQLLPSAHSRSEDVRSFFDATSVMG